MHIIDIQQWTKAHAFELGLVHEPSHNIMKDRSIRTSLGIPSFPSRIVQPIFAFIGTPEIGQVLETDYQLQLTFPPYPSLSLPRLVEH